MLVMIRPAALLTLLVLAFPAHAGEPPLRLEYAPTADYVSLSEADFVSRFYPDVALRTEQSGQALLECEVGADLRPTACTVVEESPAGLRFGQQALRMVAQYKVSATSNGAVPGARFRFPMAFKIPAA